MGLLRAMADVVLVGAGTVRAAPTHEWTPRRVHRRSAELYATWRHDLGIADPQPTTIVATASGALDLRHPGLSAPDVPVIIATTDEGADRLRAADPGPNVRVEVASDDGQVPAAGLIEIAAAAGARLVLCEGGPHLIGDLIAARAARRAVPHRGTAGRRPWQERAPTRPRRGQRIRCRDGAVGGSRVGAPGRRPPVPPVSLRRPGPVERAPALPLTRFDRETTPRRAPYVLVRPPATAHTRSSFPTGGTGCPRTWICMTSRE